ncbi:MAG: hypothetical protein KatS3mg053_2297 [Candidatus Roseilinea sp.]|nr:MAG: hypothetical protein KatS3mg053_2297 [Candidatus Roseilinea sp.]
MNRAEVKAQVMAKVEVALDAALDEQERQGKLDLTQLEDLLLTLSDQIGREMLQVLIESQDAFTAPSSKVNGDRLAYKGKKRP